jgi:hypothetical protein
MNTVAQQVQEATGQKPKKITIQDAAVCVRIKFGKVGTSRKVANKTIVTQDKNGEDVETKVVTVDADAELIKVSKTLLSSPEMDAINSFYAEVRKWVRLRVNASKIDEGLFWLGLRLIKEFDDQMKTYSAQLEPLLDNLAEAYEGIIEADRARLRTAFEEDDYPAPDKVREAFKIDWYYIQFDTPRSLQAVSEEIYQKAQDDMNRTIQTAQSAVQLALRYEMAELADWAIDRLSPGKDGKRKILRTKTKSGEEIGLTAKLHQFFETFQGRNITSDAELQGLVSKAEAVMTGVDGDSLKGSDSLRDTLRQTFTEIKAELEPLISDAPSRAIEVL